MDYVYQEFAYEPDGLGRDEVYTKIFRTERGAIGHASTRLPEAKYGYISRNTFEGSGIFRKRIIAEWKRNGKIVAWVWA